MSGEVYFYCSYAHVWNNGEPPVAMMYSKKTLGLALFVTVLIGTNALFLNGNQSTLSLMYPLCGIWNKNGRVARVK